VRPEETFAECTIVADLKREGPLLAELRESKHRIRDDTDEVTGQDNLLSRLLKRIRQTISLGWWNEESQRTKPGAPGLHRRKPERLQYVVMIELGGDEVGRGPLKGLIKLGMAAQMDIVTDQERLVSLLVRRIRQSISLDREANWTLTHGSLPPASGVFQPSEAAVILFSRWFLNRTKGDCHVPSRGGLWSDPIERRPVHVDREGRARPDGALSPEPICVPRPFSRSTALKERSGGLNRRRPWIWFPGLCTHNAAKAAWRIS
jgi:hypothetical protein